MKNNMQGRTATIVLAMLGLVAAAGMALAVTMSARSAVLSTKPNPLVLDVRPVNEYIASALQINALYKEGKITRAEIKKRALALTVPPVLKDRHLQWVLALDAKNDKAIDELMNDYALVQVTK